MTKQFSAPRLASPGGDAASNSRMTSISSSSSNVIKADESPRLKLLILEDV